MSRPAPRLAQIVVQPSQMVPGVLTRINLPFVADFLFLPLIFTQTSAAGIFEVGDNSADLEDTYAIQINDEPVLMCWSSVGPNNGFIGVFEGTVDHFSISVLGNIAPSGPVTFIVGKDCDLGSSNAVFAEH